MEHLLNCHGEIAALAAFLSSLPMVGVLIRGFLLRLPHLHKESSP